jgi:hypothetical protein
VKRAKPYRKRPISVTVYLDAAEFLELQALADEVGESQGWTVRRALRELRRSIVNGQCRDISRRASADEREEKDGHGRIDAQP